MHMIQNLTESIEIERKLLHQTITKKKSILYRLKLENQENMELSNES